MNAEIISRSAPIPEPPTLFERVKSFVTGVPIVNEPLAAAIGMFGGSAIRTQPINFDTLWMYFKDSPESQMCITPIVEDIVSDGIYFEGGRNNILAAETFINKNFFREEFKSALYDLFVTGNAYLYIERIERERVKSEIERIYDSLSKEEKIKAQTGTMERLDESFFFPRKIRCIASSTVNVVFDEQGVPQKYVQIVAHKKVDIPADKMIHLKLMVLNGQVYGYTPYQAVIREQDIIANIKDYARYFFEQGGIPNKLFIVEDEFRGSPTFQDFQRALESYQNMATKRKNLIVTGKVRVEDLNPMTRDMEFRQLAIYLSQIIAGLFSIPANRLPGFMRSEIKGTSDETGYYRKIKHLQDYLENSMTEYIFNYFNVKMKFRRGYLKDEVKEAQTEQMKVDTFSKLQSELFKYKKRIKIDRMRMEFNLGEDIEDVPEEDLNALVPQGNGTNRQDQMKVQDLDKSEEKMAADKKRQATQASK